MLQTFLSLFNLRLAHLEDLTEDCSLLEAFSCHNCLTASLDDSRHAATKEAMAGFVFVKLN
jgi:hypothetical protein